MCGVVGFFAKNRDEVKFEALKRATKSIEHRGPDGQKHWLAPHRRVGLGHARLSIIDLTTGDQPLTNEAGDIHAVVNGELYGFESIRSELEKKGHRFRTKSDSEIVLHLYEEHGTDALSFLRGEFAIILWDERNQQLFAARDRFGIKPLYYSWLGNTLILASEIKALLAAGVPAEWDEEMMVHTNYGPLLPHRTFFKNIFQVPPGHFLLANEHHTREIPYWDFDYPVEPFAKELSESEYIEQVHEQLNEAIRLRLRADVPVGVYLSGGLDSSAVLGMAARHCTSPLHAFTLTFDHADYDESALAEETAKHVGAHWYPIPITDQDIADNFMASIRHSELYAANTHGVAKFLLSKAVRKAGYKVVLTGEGSDEIFGGYAHFRQDMVLHRGDSDPTLIKNQLATLNEANVVSQGFLIARPDAPPIESAVKAIGFTPSFLAIQAGGGAKIAELFDPELNERYKTRDSIGVMLGHFDINRQLRGRLPVHQAMYLWSRTVLPNYLLNFLGDRMEMANSIEGRVPFLDHRLVETVTRIPAHYKIRGITEKYVLREATKPYITNNLYKRQKHPFTAPPVSMRDKGPLAQLMQDYLRSSKMQNVRFFNHKKVAELLDDLPNMSISQRRMIDPVLMKILGTVAMQETFGLK